MPPPRITVLNRAGNRNNRRDRNDEYDDDPATGGSYDDETVETILAECDALRAQNDAIRAQLMEALAASGLTDDEIAQVVPEVIPTSEIASEPTPSYRAPPPPRVTRATPAKRRGQIGRIDAAKATSRREAQANEDLGDLVYEKRTPAGGMLRVFRKPIERVPTREEVEAMRAGLIPAAPGVRVNGTVRRPLTAAATALRQSNTVPVAPVAPATQTMTTSVTAAIDAARARNGRAASASTTEAAEGASNAAQAQSPTPSARASREAEDHFAFIEIDLPEPIPQSRGRI